MFPDKKHMAFVIGPLVSLMHNQIASLEKMGITAVHAKGKKDRKGTHLLTSIDEMNNNR